MKKISRRNFLKVTGIGAAAAALAACGAESSSAAGSSSASTSGSAATAEPVTLKWATWGETEEFHFYHLVKAFNEIDPNFQVEIVNLGTSEYQTAISTQLAGGSGELDLISIKDMANYINLSSLGMVESLNGYVEESGLEIDKLSGLVESFTYEDGAYYMLPFTKQFWLVFYNKDLFDAAGEPYPTNDMTWDEYDAIARRVTQGEGADRVYGCYYHTWNSCVQLPGILSGKHTIIDGDYEFLKPYYERALAAQQDEISMDYATLKTASIHYSGVFQNSQVAMMHNGNWYVSSQLNAVNDGTATSTNWGMVKYPHEEGVEPGTTLGTTAGISINAKSENKELAYKFMQFVCGEEGAKIIAEIGAFPALDSEEAFNIVIDLPGFPSDENSVEALKTSKIYLEVPLSEYAADIQTLLNETHDNIMTENVTIDEGIAELTEAVAGVLG